MPMYKLHPTFAPNTKVEPKIACYRVASYHDSSSKFEECDSVKKETDPRKDLEQRQQQLIERLKVQSEKLKQLVGEFGEKNNSQPTSTPTSGKPEKKTQNTNPEPNNGGKKDKDGKKEARKAAKAEAVKKSAVGEKKVSNSNGKTIRETQWTVEDDRKTWETNLTLTVNIPPSLVHYKQEHLKELTLTVRDCDLKWVQALSKIGEKREVAFEGEVKNKATKKQTVVKVVKGTIPSLQLDKVVVKSLQTIWKLLGTSLGLFSRQSQQVLSSSHQAIWFNKAEKILLGDGDLSYSTREASQFLARFDSLSSQWEVSLADVIFRSLLNHSESLPNNVETWAKKIDSLVI
ncbi:unnamed protein product [Caenorhabditis brenneri]